MNAKPILAILLAAAVVAFVPACKRGDIDEPGPTGPSSFAIYLKATANPNTLFAGEARGVSTISANLAKYDGPPVRNKTGYLEIVDAAGNKITQAPGFFDGDTTVKIASTDSGGNITTGYHGPTGAELEYLLDTNNDGYIDDDWVNQTAPNLEYYVRVSAATDGARFVSDVVPIYLICEDLYYSIELRAIPETLYATSERQRAEIVATVKKGGKPLAGKRVWFELLSPQGFFEEGMGVQVQTVLDGAGQARVGYLGPLGAELSEKDVGIIIMARAETDTRLPPAKDGQGPVQVKKYVYLHAIKQE